MNKHYLRTLRNVYRQRYWKCLRCKIQIKNTKLLSYHTILSHIEAWRTAL